MDNSDKETVSKSFNLRERFKNEFCKENLSLNFEKNSQFMEKDPEEILEYFHSSIWPCLNGSLFYVIYRIFIAIYYTIWFVESIVRNYEFRSQNFYITTKKNINLLLLHPWPVYMTSWSLTILFVHLWLSAFITLYFYSIDQKTILSRFFHFFFGPFSCSSKVQNIQFQNSQSSKQTNSATVSDFSEAFIRKDTNTNDESESVCKTTCSIRKTYCDNKHNCHLPSSTVASNSEAWKLWIQAHVPKVLLVLIKISWLFYNIIVISAIVVTTGYFTYAFIMDMETEPTWTAEIGNLHRHGFNSLVAIVDIILLAYPVKILHFVYTCAYGWCYAIVTFIYWIQDTKKNIVYEQIDYGKPFQIALIFTMLTILTFVMQIIHFLAYQLKLYLKEKYVEMKKKCFSNDSSV